MGFARGYDNYTLRDTTGIRQLRVGVWIRFTLMCAHMRSSSLMHLYFFFAFHDWYGLCTWRIHIELLLLHFEDRLKLSPRVNSSLQLKPNFRTPGRCGDCFVL